MKILALILGLGAWTFTDQIANPAPDSAVVEHLKNEKFDPELYELAYRPPELLVAFSQHNLRNMQGIWANVKNEMDTVENSFLIVIDNRLLSFVHPIQGNRVNFPLAEFIVGFRDNISERDSVKIGDLKTEGLFYSIVNVREIRSKEWVRTKTIISPKYFECDGETLSINGGQLVEYYKIKSLPEYTLEKMYDRGKRDNKKYLQIYAGLAVGRIKVNRAILYDKAGKPNNLTLEKGAVVLIKQKENQKAMIEFQNQKGQKFLSWIKLTDIEQ